jgi:predicted RNA-binding protein associated with RNAse of E/G family
VNKRLLDPHARRLVLCNDCTDSVGNRAESMREIVVRASVNHAVVDVDEARSAVRNETIAAVVRAWVDAHHDVPFSARHHEAP